MTQEFTINIENKDVDMNTITIFLNFNTPKK